jgi:hypothetical protein
MRPSTSVAPRDLALAKEFVRRLAQEVEPHLFRVTLRGLRARVTQMRSRISISSLHEGQMIHKERAEKRLPALPVLLRWRAASSSRSLLPSRSFSNSIRDSVSREQLRRKGRRCKLVPLAPGEESQITRKWAKVKPSEFNLTVLSNFL